MKTEYRVNLTPEDQAIIKKIPRAFLIGYRIGDIIDFWFMVDLTQWGKTFNPDE